MKRRDFLKRCLAAAAGGVVLSNKGIEAIRTKNQKPNFLFVIADDCTFRDIGCYGGQANTPNID
ncbi:MAG: twin-arginine translocation signal domain-containing protein, partial [Planctomycetes bacterium]|nr:twin-arginine translocation signal domain-containing protein [Planctomycetota bacterium]